MTNAYTEDNLIRCSVTFTNSAGTAIDPTTVLFKFRDPSGTITTYTYGVDVEIVKTATGAYYVDVNGNSEGIWTYRFESTTSGEEAAEEAQFRVNDSVFD